MLWLVRRTALRAPHRLLLAAAAVAFPVATLAATTLFIDDAARSMTRVALEPVQVDQRALATSLGVDLHQVAAQLRAVPEVSAADVFSAADVVLSVPGSQNRISARLFAVDPAYLQHHPWLRVSGDLGHGALLDPGVAASPGFAAATSISISLKGAAKPPVLSLPVAGRVDLRDAAPTWFAIPYGEVQGDIAVVPRAIVVDDATFQRALLPALRSALGGATAVTNPGLSDLPPVSREVHVTLQRSAYPADPYRAAAWSATMRRTMERQVPGDVLIADNAEEPLQEAGVDATNAKILFLLLGVPGVLVAAALGLAAGAALSEAHRAEEALLRLRGASERQLVNLAVADGLLAGALGTVAGLLVAGLGVSVVVGHPAWQGVSTAGIGVSALLALLAGAIVTAARVVPLVRAPRRSSLAVQRRALAGARAPLWRRANVDVLAVVVGLVILALNVLTGGLRPTPIEGQALLLAFYVLLAPLALWFGVVLLAVRGLSALLARTARPQEPRPLTSWPGAALRWLSRRPARTTSALVLSCLAVAFGTQVATFVATYDSAKRADATAAFAADLRLQPATDQLQESPPTPREITASTPIRFVPARAGSDRKTIMAIHLASYSSAASGRIQLLRGGGLDALASAPGNVLVAQEIAHGFGLRIGDTLPVTVFPDEKNRSATLALRVVGVFRAVPPTDPPAEFVVADGTIPAPLPAPDFYLAHLAAGQHPEQAAQRLNQSGTLGHFTAVPAGAVTRTWQRSLTALNLSGLSRIEAVAAALIAAVGVGLLGAFLVLERRREFALLRMIGADRRQVLVPPAVEGGIAVVGSLVIGIPVGVGLAALEVRVLSFFFALPPPIVDVPVAAIGALAALVVTSCCLAFALALFAILRTDLAPLLRER